MKKLVKFIVLIFVTITSSFAFTSCSSSTLNTEVQAKSRDSVTKKSSSDIELIKIGEVTPTGNDDFPHGFFYKKNTYYYVIDKKTNLVFYQTNVIAETTVKGANDSVSTSLTQLFDTDGKPMTVDKLKELIKESEN